MTLSFTPLLTVAILVVAFLTVTLVTLAIMASLQTRLTRRAAPQLIAVSRHTTRYTTRAEARS